MKLKLLVIIESTPGAQTKGLEGLRVAAGLAAWGQFEVAVCLKGTVPAEDDDAQTGLSVAGHIALLRQSGSQLLQLAAAGRTPGKKKPSSTGSGFERISMKALTIIALESRHTLIF